MSFVRTIIALLLLSIYTVVVLHNVIPHCHTSDNHDGSHHVIGHNHHHGHEHHNEHHNHDHGHDHNDSVHDFLDFVLGLMDDFDNSEHSDDVWTAYITQSGKSLKTTKEYNLDTAIVAYVLTFAPVNEEQESGFIIDVNQSASGTFVGASTLLRGPPAVA